MNVCFTLSFLRFFIGGFPTQETKIQQSVSQPFMQGQIEGLVVGDKEMGLWNYKDAQEIQGAMGRNKFRKMEERSVKFNGQGYLPVDLEFLAPVNVEFHIKMKFKYPAGTNGGNGILLLLRTRVACCVGAALSLCLFQSF